MKGDGSIIINFYGLGLKDNFQADIKLFQKNNLIFKGKTFNGKIFIPVQNNHSYKLTASFYDEFLQYNIVARKCTLNLYFNHSMLSNQTITFLLRDSNYDIPIEKGELIIWKRI